MADESNLPFHRKYRPNTLAKYIGNEKLKETAMKALSCGKRPQVILLWGDSGCGKAQPLDSHVLTTDGYKRMGDIKVGDEVFTHKGNRGRVSGIYPQGVRPIYRIKLSDRTYIDVSDEHLNCVYLYNTKKKQREDYVLTTNDLIKLFNSSKYDLRMDIPSVDWDTTEVKLNPYLVGALIGDGSFSSGNFNFSNSEEDVINKVNTILANEHKMCLTLIDNNKCDYRISSISKYKYIFTYKGDKFFGCDELKEKLCSDGYPSFDSETLVKLAKNSASHILDEFPMLRDAITVQINEDFGNTYFRDSIRDLGLDCKSTEKFIPREYLYNDRDTRIALLQGLFDTDGSISKTGLVEFSTSSKQLSDDFAFLVRSLGIRDTITERKSGYRDDYGDYIECGLSYRHYLKVPNDIMFCTSEKHLSRYYKKQHEPIRKIESIKYIGDQECQCIMIDHPDHTYISDYFIPTHNTTFARLLAKEYSCFERDDVTGACNHCSNCEAINDYIATGDTSLLTNVQEIDITDQSGKRDLNAVLEDMTIPAFGDEWKIYIFDECHKASDALQNRLLKITEEPPEHVLMIFCTTNPEKLIDTLKNRCQLQLQVKKPKVKELAGLLRYVCECEQVEYDMKGLEFIANRGELTIRTALQNLQQVVNEQNAARYENATQVFEEISNTLIINFFKSLKSKDILRYITLLYEIKSKMDLSAFLVELRDFIKRGIYTINGIQQDGVSDNELKVYRDLFGDLGIGQICVLLSKVMSLDMKNLELELITLGYTGFDEVKQLQDEVVIPVVDNELKLETKNADKVIKQREEVSFEKGVENASSQMQGIDIDSILSMGGTLVE